MHAVDDRDGGRQHQDIVDVNVLQLLAGAELHDLHLGRVQPQSAGSHPLTNIMDADSELWKATRVSLTGRHTGGCAHSRKQSSVCLYVNHGGTNHNGYVQTYWWTLITNYKLGHISKGVQHFGKLIKLFAPSFSATPAHRSAPRHPTFRLAPRRQ